MSPDNRQAAAVTVEGPASFTRHRGPVTCVAGIPGKQAAVSSAYDSAVAYVDLAAGRMTFLGGHDHLVNRIVVNAGGSLAASCSSDYSICLWDLESRTARRRLLGHSDDVEDFAFVDETTGISASRDRRIIVWDLKTGAVRRVIFGHDKDVLSVAFAKGLIYSSGDDMTLRQWDLASGRMLRCWGPFAEETDSCAIDPLNDRVLLGSDDGRIRIFDSRSGSALGEVEAHAAGIKKVAVSPSNGDILSAGYDQRIRIWDARALDPKLDLAHHPATWERSFNWSPDGSRLLAGSFDGTVLVWDAANGACLAEIGGEGPVLGNACFNDVSADPKGELAAVSDDGLLRLGKLEPSGADWRKACQPASGRVLMNAVILDPVKERVVAGAHDQALYLFERIGGTAAERRLPLAEGPVNCVRVAEAPGYEGQVFAACYSGAVLRVDPDDGRIKSAIRLHQGAVKALRLHPHAPLGVSCGADGLLLSWGFDGRLRRSFHGHTAIVDDLDLEPDGARLASTSRDFSLKVYDLESGVMAHAVDLGQQSPKSLLFWDRDCVIVGNYWGYLLRIDLRDESVTRRRISDNGISALSRCGNALVAAAYDGSLSLVDPESLEVLQQLRAMVQKPWADRPAEPSA